MLLCCAFTELYIDAVEKIKQILSKLVPLTTAHTQIWKLERRDFPECFEMVEAKSKKNMAQTCPALSDDN